MAIVDYARMKIIPKDGKIVLFEATVIESKKEIVLSALSEEHIYFLEVEEVQEDSKDT